MSLTRRSVLKLGAIGVLGGAAGLTLPMGRSVQAKSASRLPKGQMPTPYAVSLQRPPVLAPYQTGVDPDGAPVHYYSVTERVGQARILPRLDTQVWGYNGIFPGPTISVDQGTRAVLRVRNRLPASHPLFGHRFDTSTHLHGSASKPQYDGYANDLTAPGFYKEYRYPNLQPARTLWYHDHAAHFTAQNVYSGLAAQYHLHDPAERELLPAGRYDVPLTVSDAIFAADGSLSFDDHTHSGLWGDVILVNGRPWPVMKVKRRVYRFRVLNASIARSYRPTLSSGAPVTVVATDGGLVPRSREVGSWRHGSAERYEILIDFRRYREGQGIELRNRSNPTTSPTATPTRSWPSTSSPTRRSTPSSAVPTVPATGP